MINGPADLPSAEAADRRDSVGRLLEHLRGGHREALEELFPLVYEELRELAHSQRARWRDDETLNTTALVHEAYLKLVDQRRNDWDTESHFLAAASRAIRHILINYARDRRAQKRGGDWRQVSLGAAEDVDAPSTAFAWEDGAIALEDALQRLSLISERQGRIVECRFFGGMTVDQTARALGLSTATVVRGWTMAQAWLRNDLGGTHAI